MGDSLVSPSGSSFIHFFPVLLQELSEGPRRPHPAWLLIKECGLRTEFVNSSISSLREGIYFCVEPNWINYMQAEYA